MFDVGFRCVCGCAAGLTGGFLVSVAMIIMHIIVARICLLCKGLVYSVSVKLRVDRRHCYRKMSVMMLNRNWCAL